MTWFDKIPDEYQEHLPGPGPSRKETFRGVAERGFDEGIEPFLEVGGNVKASLKRIYEVAAQPLGGETTKPKPLREAPFEFLGSLAAYVAAMPIKVVGDLIEKSGKVRKEGANMLLGGPRGELGEWTSEQVGMAQAATEVTLGAMVGGGPGGGTGPANILRKDALKMLAKEFKEMKKTIPGVSKRTWSYFKQTGAVSKTAVKPIVQAEAGYRKVAKGLRDIPQAILDPVKEVGLTRKPNIFGHYLPGEKRVAYNITKKILKETIPHEFLHTVQHTKLGDRGITRMPTRVLEAHAYEFEPLFMKEMAQLPKGQKMSGRRFKELYNESLKTMTDKYGKDFSKYRMAEILENRDIARVGRLFEEKYPGAKMEFKSSAPPKIGELVELPGGKARFDGTWDAFGRHPEQQQYTFLEGVAKGDTFVSGSHKVADVAAAGLRKIKMRGGGGS